MASPRLYDIHSHVNFTAFRQDADEVLQRTLAGGVWTNLVGSQIDTSRRAIAYAEQYPEGVYAVVGLHPIHLFEMEVDGEELDAEAGTENFRTRKEEFDYDVYRALAGHPKVVAIGECGLDYYHIADFGTPRREAAIALQQETFRRHIALAREVKKPLMIHCRNAYYDLIQILKEEHGEEIGGDVHFFAGSWEIAKRFLELGFHLSFTGVLTFTHDYDEVVRNAPLERIMVETDAPYVAPVPYRGKRNEPLYVEYAARRIAEIRGLAPEEVFRQTTANAVHLFHTSG